jgi:hypothetical protein
MPTLEPRFAGLTNIGYFSAFSRSAAIFCGAFSHSWRRNTRYGQTGRPRPMNAIFIIPLSMPTAEASTPPPT